MISYFNGPDLTVTIRIEVIIFKHNILHHVVGEIEGKGLAAHSNQVKDN